MGLTIRRVFPYAMMVIVLSAVAWAVSFGTLPPAEFTFTNGDDVETVDPSKATGQPEQRVLSGLWEGLLRNMPAADQPDANGLMPMTPQPAVAEALPEVSADGKTYTFRIRPSARWSNGRPVDAYDFVWAWRRCLHPDTGSKYAYQLYYLANAEKYNTLDVSTGDRVEVEHADRADPLQPFPRGTVDRGILRDILKPAEPQPPASATPEQLKDFEKQLADWRSQWVYLVEVKPEGPTASAAPAEVNLPIVDWEASGVTRAFAQQINGDLAAEVNSRYQADIETCQHLLFDFTGVGVRADDSQTLVVTLENATAYFNELVCFYTLYPTSRECVEQYGTPQWTKPENIVSNGPYKLQFRRVRDRLRLVKNEHYWDADRVALQSIDVLAIKHHTTGLNLFIKNQVQWASDVPKLMIPELKDRDDFVSAPVLITYFYRVNVTRPPMDNVLIRQALNMSIDKKQICESVTRAGEQPARSLVTPGIPGYELGLCSEYNLERARELLAEAGYPGGRGMPKVEILFNTDDNHRALAEVIGQMWKNNLGIDVEYKNVAWTNYLQKQRTLDYNVSRAGWIGDYPDPNTYLDMFVTGGGQNQTGWSDARYDELIKLAAVESDPERRLELLHEAETLLMTELPIIPIYYYVSINMVKTNVEGFHANLLDKHPLHIMRYKN